VPEVADPRALASPSSIGTDATPPQPARAASATTPTKENAKRIVWVQS
jgi:hypothetical protein